MTRIGTTTAGACLLALAACSGGGSDKGEGGTAAAGTGNGATTAAAGAAGSSGGGEIRLQPGQWEMKVEMTNAGMPDMPEGMADAMKNVATTTTSCLTEEDTAKPTVFTGKQDDSCKHEGFSSTGGKISGTIRCDGGGEGGGKVTIKTEGRFTPTSFESSSRSEIEAEGTKMVTEARVTGRRIGECPAGGKAG